MIIIFGKKLPDSKKIRYALTNIFGIGFASANKICNILNIPNTVKISDLTEVQKQILIGYIKQNFIIESKLKQQIHSNIQDLIITNSVKGFRHRNKLPVRGQRTHSNAKTCKKINIKF
jgi:small subunit ribosomal protein S13